MDARLSDVLDEAVARGVISAEQREQMLLIAGGAAESSRGRTAELLAWAREVPRGFNAITIAYGVGALAVVFALGWFLADRWALLGPGGVLAVGLIYAAMFGLAARVFGRERFPTAHGVAIALIVVTVPLVVWSLLRMTDVWPGDLRGACSIATRPFWDCRSPVVVLAASTLAATLIGMRWLRFGPLMIPGAAAIAVGLSQIAMETSRTASGAELYGWPFTFTASVLAMLAYETDLRRRREDYGRWLHLGAVVCATIALIGLFDTERELRHLLLPASLAIMAASLLLRRIVWLVLGLGSLFFYLTWLATSVFERAVAFPVILATVGITIMLLTVWVQRSYPRLAARVRETDGGMAQFPGGSALLLAPALVAALVMPAARDAAEVQWERREAEAERARLESERGLPARAAPVRPPPPGESRSR